MSKRVVVIASGETERRALPALLDHLAAEGIAVDDIRTPPRHRAIKVEVAEKIIRSVWFERRDDERPHKFVVLVDTDASPPEEALASIRNRLPGRLQDINASIQFAYAQQHFEAWYFADARGLRYYLRRDLGAVDQSQPDAIPNPKLHLKHLLGSRIYTSLVSRDIASRLDATAIAQHSPSFRGFLAAVRNGDANELQGTRH